MGTISYKQQILFGFVLLISLIELAVISYDVHKAYQLRIDFLQQRSQLLSQTYSQALVTPVWNIDSETIESILKGILLDPDVIKVQLEYHDNSLPIKQLSRHSNSNQPVDSNKVNKDIFVTDYAINEPDSSRNLAILKIYFSPHSLKNFLSERLIEGGLQFILLLLINFLLVKLLINWITSPLTRLSLAISQLAKNDPNIFIPETKRNDEIGNVARSVEVFKKNSLELNDLRMSMEKKIAVQTKDLVIAKEKAEAATIAKSQFLATMSHEIRTPLNGVMGMAQILSETSLNKEQQENLKIILSSGQNLIHLINEVLDFSKLDAHQLKLESICFNLKQLIEDIFKLLSTSINASQIQLLLNYPDSIPTSFIGDPIRVRQILINIIGNAIKFTEHGSISVSVNFQTIDPSAPNLTITIKDTGIGIHPDQIDSLFKSFTQADQATTRKYGGTGLGLSICKRLVELMGGNIKVDSTPNIGSTFTLLLNLEENTISATDTNLQQNIKVKEGVEFNSEDQGIEMTNPILKNRILLVEDNLVNQKIASMMLTKLGFKVDLAIDGEKAVQLWQKTQPIFIYMDCLMPTMDGYQASREIRKLQDETNTPIIVALTANASKEDVEKCLSSGMNDVVTKPFKKSDLINNLNKWGKQLSIQS